MLRVVLLCCLSIVYGFAHKLNIFTTVEQHNLFVQAYFANGQGCQNCKVILEDKNRVLSIESRTNNKGEVNFFVNEGEYDLKVDAGSGHELHEHIMIQPVIKQKSNEPNTFEKQNIQLKNQIASLQQQLEWMNILKTILAVVAIIVIFGFLKRMRQ